MTVGHALAMTSKSADVRYESSSQFDPVFLAILYYFGDLGYENLPRIAADALEQGFDGKSLRRLAGLQNPVLADIPRQEIDDAFGELGVAAPIPKSGAQLALATQCAMEALSGKINVFDAATHVRVYICELKDDLTELSHICVLSKKAKDAPVNQWPVLEQQLVDAFSELVTQREHTDAKLRSLA
jgi:hypothetical protein